MKDQIDTIERALSRYAKMKWPSTTDGAPSVDELIAMDALDAISDIRHGHEEHNKLIRTCSPIVTEEDGSDLIPNWCRVENAIRRILIKKGKLVRLVREAQDIMNRNDVHDSEWAVDAYRECPTDFSER